jgi:hypothetical protein
MASTGTLAFLYLHGAHLCNPQDVQQTVLLKLLEYQ